MKWYTHFIILTLAATFAQAQYAPLNINYLTVTEGLNDGIYLRHSYQKNIVNPKPIFEHTRYERILVCRVKKNLNA